MDEIQYVTTTCWFVVQSLCYISRVPDQNGVSLACYIVEIYLSGLETSVYFMQVIFKGENVASVIL